MTSRWRPGFGPFPGRGRSVAASRPPSTDHYQVLGVEPDANAEEIRRAYLRQARRLHPDFHSDADASTRTSLQRKMQQVNASWGVLSDPEQRQRYDRVRPVAESTGRSSGRARTRDAEPRRRRSELQDEVRSTYDDAGPNDPVRARLVALSVVSLGVAVVMFMAWVLVGWRGFGAGLMIALLVAFGAFAAVPLSAVFTSYRNDRA